MAQLTADNNNRKSKSRQVSPSKEALVFWLNVISTFSLCLFICACSFTVILFAGLDTFISPTSVFFLFVLGSYGFCKSMADLWKLYMWSLMTYTDEKLLTELI